jgi:hypothetical protein
MSSDDEPSAGKPDPYELHPHMAPGADAVPVETRRRRPPYSAMRPRRARKLLLLKWGDEYEIKAPRFWPRRPNWSARARATGELMIAADPDELAGAVLRHYVARIAREYHKRVGREERERPPPRPAPVSSLPKPRIPERPAIRRELRLVAFLAVHGARGRSSSR